MNKHLKQPRLRGLSVASRWPLSSAAFIAARQGAFIADTGLFRSTQPETPQTTTPVIGAKERELML